MTIKEIWEQTPADPRSKLLAAVVGDGLAPSTAYAYFNGDRRPKPYYRTRLQLLLKKYTNFDVPVSELWPD